MWLWYVIVSDWEDIASEDIEEEDGCDYIHPLQVTLQPGEIPESNRP